mmetsp:Transcript_10252/g.34324  ORF Transcript_10252/g.34324 Transcript_10252/m.34324 type:complete len:350 (+) Transcript_10252:881-1930(+)
MPVQWRERGRLLGRHVRTPPPLPRSPCQARSGVQLRPPHGRARPGHRLASADLRPSSLPGTHGLSPPPRRFARHPDRRHDEKVPHRPLLARPQHRLPPRHHRPPPSPREHTRPLLVRPRTRGSLQGAAAASRHAYAEGGSPSSREPAAHLRGGEPIPDGLRGRAARGQVHAVRRRSARPSPRALAWRGAGGARRQRLRRLGARPASDGRRPRRPHAAAARHDAARREAGRRGDERRLHGASGARPDGGASDLLEGGLRCTPAARQERDQRAVGQVEAARHPPAGEARRLMGAHRRARHAGARHARAGGGLGTQAAEQRAAAAAAAPDVHRAAWELERADARAVQPQEGC